MALRPRSICLGQAFQTSKLKKEKIRGKHYSHMANLLIVLLLLILLLVLLFLSSNTNRSLIENNFVWTNCLWKWQTTICSKEILETPLWFPACFLLFNRNSENHNDILLVLLALLCFTSCKQRFVPTTPDSRTLQISKNKQSLDLMKCWQNDVCFLQNTKIRIP